MPPRPTPDLERLIPTQPNCRQSAAPRRRSSRLRRIPPGGPRVASVERGDADPQTDGTRAGERPVRNGPATDRTFRKRLFWARRQRLGVGDVRTRTLPPPEVLESRR